VGASWSEPSRAQHAGSSTARQEISREVRYAALAILRFKFGNAGLRSDPGPPVSLPQRKSSWQRLRSAGRSVDFALNLGGSLGLPVQSASVSTFLGHHVPSDVLKSLARGSARATRLSLVRFTSLLHRCHALWSPPPDNRLATPARNNQQEAESNETSKMLFTTNLV
jgi:hypothetical protein